MDGACGRADLLRVLVRSGPDALAAAADVLGYQTPTPEARPEQRPEPSDLPLEQPLREAAHDIDRRPLARVPLWRLEEYLDTDPQKDDGGAVSGRPSEPEAELLVPVDFDSTAPAVQPLAPWRALVPRMRRTVALQTEGYAVDVDALVSRLGRGETLRRLPRVRRLRYGDHVQVVIDRSIRLVPFWDDQKSIYRHLWRYLPDHAVELAFFREARGETVIVTDGGRETIYRPPPPGALVVVLGDLGCFAGGAPQVARHWMAFGQRLRDAGCRPVALTPCPARRWPPSVRWVWRLLEWERPMALTIEDRAADPDLAERLLRLVSPAVRIEPGFLRDVRRLLEPFGADAGTEADAWNHPAMVGRSYAGGTLDADEAERLRREFSGEPWHLRVQVLERLRRWRVGLPEEIWFTELAGLDAETRRFTSVEDREAARRFIVWLARRVRGLSDEPAPAGWRGWFRLNRSLLINAAVTDPTLKSDIDHLWWASHRSDSEAMPPPDFDMAVTATEAGDPRYFELRQNGGDVAVTPAGSAVSPGGYLGAIRGRGDVIKIEPKAARVDASFWASGSPPL